MNLGLRQPPQVTVWKLTDQEVFSHFIDQEIKAQAPAMSCVDPLTVTINLDLSRRV